MNNENEVVVQDLIVTDLQVNRDDRGSIMHMLRADDREFVAFGEIYFSTILPKIIKGWKRHRESTMNVACIHGSIAFAVYDDRPKSRSQGRTQIFVLGRMERYARITVPPMLWTGFKNICDSEAILANCATQPHRPDEADNRAYNDPNMPEIWSI